MAKVAGISFRFPDMVIHHVNDQGYVIHARRGVELTFDRLVWALQTEVQLPEETVVELFLLEDDSLRSFVGPWNGVRHEFARSPALFANHIEIRENPGHPVRKGFSSFSERIERIEREVRV